MIPRSPNRSSRPRALRLALLLSAFLFAGVRDAAALCIAPETPCREYERTPIIFQGLVERVSIVDQGDPILPSQTDHLAWLRINGGRLWHIKVERQWKGLGGVQEVDVLTYGVPGKSWVEDEVDFKIGKRYVIWASRLDGQAALRTHGCSLTRPLDAAPDQIEFLESLSQPAAGGYVYGRVPMPSDLGSMASPEGLAVVLEGMGIRRETRTDKDGRFRFAGLRDGRYDLSLVLPPTLAPWGTAGTDPTARSSVRATVTIKGPRDCDSADLLVQSSALMWGFAAFEGGKPASGIVVQAVRLDLLQQQELNRANGRFSFLMSQRSTTNERGRFEFPNLPPGRYLVGVTLAEDPNPQQPFHRLLHPGVTEIDEATVFDVEPGQQLDAGILKLPPPLTPVKVHGQVVTESGDPAEGAFVSLVNNRKGRLAGVRTDKNGEFTLSLFPGYSYVLTATLSSGTARFAGQAECSLEQASDAPPKIRIQLQSREGAPRR